MSEARLMSTGDAREALGLPREAFDTDGNRISMTVAANTYWGALSRAENAERDLKKSQEIYVVLFDQYEVMTNHNDYLQELADRRESSISRRITAYDKLHINLDEAEEQIEAYHRLILVGVPIVTIVAVILTLFLTT